MLQGHTSSAVQMEEGKGGVQIREGQSWRDLALDL